MAIVRSAFIHSLAHSLIRFAAPATLLVAATLPACSSDNSSSPSDGGVDTGGTTSTGGARATGGTTSTGGAKATGGATSTGGTTTGTGGTTTATGGATSTGGKDGGGGTGGTTGSGGATATGGATSTGGTADASNDAGPVPPACAVRPDGGSRGRVALAGLTDFSTAAEFASIDLGTGAVLNDIVYPDQDSIPVSHGGLGFVLERTLSRVNTLCGDGSIQFPIDLDHSDGGTLGLNPHDVVPVPGTTKAYVSLYGANRIAILDLSTGAVTGSIDVGRFLDPSDHDGLVEIDLGVYDPTTKLVYFALQRLANFKCPSVPSLLIGVDPATDTLVDLPRGGSQGGTDGGKSDAGKGADSIALHFVSPASLALDGGRLFVLASGCQGEADGNTNRVRHGIEVVTLATGTTVPLYVPTTQNFLTGVSLLGDGALVSRYSDDFTSILWNHWDLSSPDLGAALADVPDAAVVETANTLIGTAGLSFSDGGFTEAVVRYDVTSGKSTIVANNPWRLGFSSAAGVAIVP